MERQFVPPSLMAAAPSIAEVASGAGTDGKSSHRSRRPLFSALSYDRVLLAIAARTILYVTGGAHLP
jgi:hypothetical protein